MSVKESLDRDLDECLRRVLSGEDAERVLASCASGDELRPLLQFLVEAIASVPPSRRRATDKATLLAAVAARRAAVEATDRYVALLKRGLPVEELLAQVPPQARAVVVAAHWMRELAPPAPKHRAAGKRQIMALAARKRLSRERPVWSLAPLREKWAAATLSIGQAVLVPRRAWVGALAAVVTVVVLLAGVAGITTVAASSVPGQPFYRLKRFGESAQLAFTFDPAERVDLTQRFAERRWSELLSLAASGNELSLQLVSEWLAADSMARKRVAGLPADQQRLLAEAIVSLAKQPLTAQEEAQALPPWLVAWAQRFGPAATTPAVTWPPDTLLREGQQAWARPLPVPRPLPPEDVVLTVPRAAETPLAVAARRPATPEPVLLVPTSGAEPVAASPSAVPALAQPDNDEMGDAAKPSAAEPVVAPVEPPTGAEEPPPFVQPPAAEATPTPESPGGEPVVP